MATESKEKKPVDNINDVIAILDQVTLPKFGTITIVMHEGKVVQVEVNEKHRL